MSHLAECSESLLFATVPGRDSGSDRALHVEGSFDDPGLTRDHPGPDPSHPVQMERHRLPGRKLLVRFKFAAIITEQPQPDGNLGAVGTANADGCVRISWLRRRQIHVAHRLTPALRKSSAE